MQPTRIRRHSTLAVAAALLVALSAGCKAKDSPGGNAGAATKTIGVSLLTREHDFYRTLEAGLQFYNGAFLDASAQYARKVLAERARLEAVVHGPRDLHEAALSASAS